MDPTVDVVTLKDPGRFRRLDATVASVLTGQFLAMRQKRELAVQQSLYGPDGPLGARRAKRISTIDSREMVRAMCAWVSHRPERGQRYTCRDFLKFAIDQQWPDDDLFYFYNEWTVV